MPANPPSNPPPSLQTEESILELAQRGNPADLPAIRAFLDEHPETSQAYGSPASYLIDALATGLSSNAFIRESAHRKLIALQAELEGPSSTPLERLLAERAAICWFQVHHCEYTLAEARDLTWREAEFHRRRIDSAHRRYLSALRALASVRKLGLPAVQVNIGQNQVNLTGPP